MAENNGPKMVDTMGKYRWRTWLRMLLPGFLTPFVPKGGKDCGDHEWHRSDATAWRCVHCRAGVTHEEPWGPIESVHLKLAAAESTLRVGKYRQLEPEEMGRAGELLGEAHEQLHSVLGRGADDADLKAALEAELAAVRSRTAGAAAVAHR